MDGLASLEWLRSRRSVRVFDDRPVAREVLERLIEAATTAPSNTNRQPWRFAVVTSPTVRASLVEAVKRRADAIKAIIHRGHHAEDFANYSDFFHEPLASAAAIVVPQYRDYPDLIANFLAASGEDASRFETAAAMQAELCSTSAAVMAMLLQAQAEGLGACWMVGPTVARSEVQAILGIREPWRMVGAVALGYPASSPAKPPRKPVERVAVWFDD